MYSFPLLDMNLHIIAESIKRTNTWRIITMEAPNSNLEELGILRNNIDDRAVAAFANYIDEQPHSIYIEHNDNPITAVVGDPSQNFFVTSRV